MRAVDPYDPNKCLDEIWEQEECQYEPCSGSDDSGNNFFGEFKSTRVSESVIQFLCNLLRPYLLNKLKKDGKIELEPRIALTSNI